MPRQLGNFPICQICGAGEQLDRAIDQGWLVSPLRADPSVNVVRCPRHISEWSLRCSQAGRTREWRQKMIDGQAWTPPPMPMLAPIPLDDLH